MFKRSDYLIFAIILFFFGLFIMSQYKAGKNYIKALAPENNALMAVEVSRLTKSNADLRIQVKKLTSDLDLYQDSSNSKKALYEKYTKDLQNYNMINGSLPKTGQGLEISIKGSLSAPQIIDLINAIKNIGSDMISINNKRVVINTDLSQFSNSQSYDILVLGNGKLLKSAMERRGGIVEQILTKDIEISLAERDNLEIPAGTPLTLQFARLIND